MSSTNCCNHRFIGGNPSSVQPDGYCLYCGSHHTEIESLKETNKLLSHEQIFEAFMSYIENVRHKGIRKHLAPPSFEIYVNQFLKDEYDAFKGAFNLLMPIIELQKDIIQELTQVAEVHLDDTFEKILKVEQMLEQLGREEMSKLYRSKPVVREAMQLTRGCADVVAKWVGRENIVGMGLGESSKDACYISIKTPKGAMVANEGDYIIKGVMGEFYPCKSDIFKMTYEPVEGVSKEIV